MTYPTPELAKLIELVTAEIRAPATYADFNDLTFDPPLTPAEQTRLAELRATIDSPVSLTVEEWDRVRPEGRNAFMALSATERDRRNRCRLRRVLVVAGGVAAIRGGSAWRCRKPPPTG